MALFFQIVLAVILVFVGLIFGGFWFFKRWLKGKVRDYAAASELLDPAWMRPARISLQPVSASAALGKKFLSLRNELRKLGFVQLGDFEDGEGLLTLSALRHETQPIMAAVHQDGTGTASFTLFAVDADKQMTALSAGPGPEYRGARLTWLVDERLSPATGWERIRERVAGQSLREPSLGLHRLAWEQAYAARMDQVLARKPRSEPVAARAAARDPAPSERQIDQAYEILLGHWREQVEVAVLDVYRRQSRIDAVEWERVQHQTQVVHGHLNADDIRILLDLDETGEQLFKQFVDQDYTGIALYEQVMQRLPGAQRRELLGEVTRPVRALIFGPAKQVASEDPGSFVYRARAQEGEQVHGAVLASNAGDAKRQLAGMGLEQVELVMEPSLVDREPDQGLFDPEQAAAAVRAIRRPLGRSILDAIAGNWLIWAPPLGLVVWTWWEGPPRGWGDYLVIGYLILALGLLVFKILPMVLYHQVLRARARGRWSSALFLLRVLERLDWFSGIGASVLALERAQLLAARNQLEQALELWQSEAGALKDLDYRQGLAQIYSSAGNHPQLIAEHRKVCAQAGAQEIHRIDLAMSLARFGNAPAEAEELIAGISPQDLSELALVGYHYVRGLTAAQRGRHSQAIHHYGQALEQVEQFQNNPLILIVVAEINGFAAVSLKRLGQAGLAGEIWDQVWPVLKVHRGSDQLEREYAKAET